MDRLSPDNDGGVRLATLTAADIDDLRLGWWSRFNANEVSFALQTEPELSVWVPDANEYLIAGPWRHRAEVIYARELVAIRHSIALIQECIARARAAGRRLFLAIESNERRSQSFYDRCGLVPLEEVVAYERGRDRMPANRRFSGPERVITLDDLNLSELIAIDHDAFPWLWQNVTAEFRDYLEQAGVEIYIMREESEAVGYLGISMYAGWGHIDRVAVRPKWQGHGYGRHLTEFAIARMTALGATSIGLSTQSRNVRSQALYERLGFRRKQAGEYRIYGALLREGDSVDNLVLGSDK
jgi:ribosomal protein S18 acetylase RimI-like enzyme